MKDTPYTAPNFSLPNSNNQIVNLADFAGSWLVVYFYPKDDTPGCTAEACSIRDTREALTSHGIKVVGISKDSVESHSKFAAKHQLNFELLSDPEGSVIEAYGAWGKKMFGKEGIQRKTFVIDPEGQIVKIYGRVNPLGHGEQLLKDIGTLQAESGAYGAGSF